MTKCCKFLDSYTVETFINDDRLFEKIGSKGNRGGDFLILKLNKKQAYGILVISIIFEQIGTGFLEACDAFTKLVPTICLILAYVASYWFFAQLLQHINLSVSYATWTAAGTVSAALIGLFAFGQHISPLGWLGIVIMCVGIFILNLYGTPKEDRDKDNVVPAAQEKEEKR